LGDDGVTVERWPQDVPSADLNGARVRPLVLRRDGEPFETLRDNADKHRARTGAAPRVFLASLGPLAVNAARTTWIRNFLAAGGIEGIGSDGCLTSVEAGQAFAQSGATVACLCSADDVYAELGVATASLLKTAGAQRVYLAGRPKELEPALRAAGVDDFLFAGIDAVAALGSLQEVLDVR
jgi:methylmalonyl-CoA mutase